MATTGKSLTELNSTYIHKFNAIFIYLAIIKDPFWPDNANETIIYAAATSIGYEITHSFDANGYIW